MKGRVSFFLCLSFVFKKLLSAKFKGQNQYTLPPLRVMGSLYSWMREV